MLPAWAQSPEKYPSVRAASASDPNAVWAAAANDAFYAVSGSGSALAAPNGAFGVIAAGEGHTCAIRADQGISCWGENRSGQALPPSSVRLRPQELGRPFRRLRPPPATSCASPRPDSAPLSYTGIPAIGFHFAWTPRMPVHPR